MLYSSLIPADHNENGTAILMLVVTIVVILISCSFAVDLNNAYNSRQRLQAALDAAVLAGTGRLSDGAVDNAALKLAVLAESRAVANSNGVSDAELLAGLELSVGRWNEATRAFDIDAVPYNAVRAGARKDVGTYFANIIGYDLLNVGGVSISALGGLGAAECLPPFAVDDDVIAGLVPGQRFVLNRASPGNWGKINLRDDIRGEQEFTEAIRDGVCDVRVAVGQAIETITGFSGVDNGITQRLSTNDVVLLPIVNAFPNGSSGTAQILGFVEVAIVHTQGMGDNWQVEMELRNTRGGSIGGGPTAQPFTQARVLVF